WVGVQDFVNESLTLGAGDMYELRIDALTNSHVADDYFALFPNNSREQFINEELLGVDSNWFADYERETYESGRSYNWLEGVTRSAVQQNHSMSFSGG